MWFGKIGANVTVSVADDDAEGKVHVVCRTAVLPLQRRQQVKYRQTRNRSIGIDEAFYAILFFRRPHRN